jgi:hypothetical protein
LLVQAFDGDITVRNLRIRDPLGLAPRLWADVKLEHLDLDTLTKTFSFGRIEGRLQGHVSNLYKEAWQPVAFDAVFETPTTTTAVIESARKPSTIFPTSAAAGWTARCRAASCGCWRTSLTRNLEFAAAWKTAAAIWAAWPRPRTAITWCRAASCRCTECVVGYSREGDWQSLTQCLVAVTAGGSPVTD